MRIETLQSLMRHNANQIYESHVYIQGCKDAAAYFKLNNRPLEAKEEYKWMAKAKKELAKLVANQVALKTELKHQYRLARIDQKFADVFPEEVRAAGFTAVEQEAMLDHLLLEKKASENAGGFYTEAPEATH